MRLAALAVAALALAAPLAHAQPDPSKVLHVAFLIAETGFDPQASSDLYSNYVNRVIFDPLFRYDYLARPHKVIPNTAAALPEASKDGKEWTIRVKPGIYFNDDPVFKGKKRELTAADYAYSWKRILDPRIRSPQLDTFDGRFMGMDKLVAKAKETGKFDYDAPLEGIQVIDKYTLRLKLTAPWWDIVSDLTGSGTAAVAREVIEAYGDGSGWAMANPVGTGPYRLKDWRRGQRILLEANPNFREVLYPESSDPVDKPIMAKLKGKRLPLIGQIDIAIIEEANPRLLAFERGQLDYVEVPVDLVSTVMEPDNTLKPRFAKAGVALQRGIQPSITYTFFNMDDPVVGGYTKEKIALRRAIGMAYNVDEEVKVIRQGQAEWASQLLPPGVAGHDPSFVGNTKYDPAAAKALLDRFGYVDRDKDGWRELPDGKPLVLRMGTSPSALERQYNELWQRNMTAVGIKIEFVTQKWPDLLKMAQLGQLEMWQLGNRSTSTEGYGFLGLLYGGNAGLANLSRFKQADYDRLYEASKLLPDGPERSKLMRQMSEIAAAYAPWKINAYRYENVMVYPWVEGYKLNVFNLHPWQYLDIGASGKSVQ
ncbi:MAG TPA: ABC transporter substrate-binding protein [Casimicrobiaceae bacterium]|nr:ABC transporter substrate-binding protein [Casimicrobiaceae bacterium]